MASPFHQGENDQGMVYDDITLILRDGEKLEWFADRARDNRHAEAEDDQAEKQRLADIAARVNAQRAAKEGAGGKA
jgi:hypothetical protein